MVKTFLKTKTRAFVLFPLLGLLCAGIGAYLEFRTSDPALEMDRMAARLQQKYHGTAQSLVELLKAEDLSHDQPEVAYQIARLLTIEKRRPNPRCIVTQWLPEDSVKGESSETIGMLYNWGKQGHYRKLTAQALTLFAQNYGQSREVILYLARLTPHIGILDYLLTQAIWGEFGVVLPQRPPEDESTEEVVWLKKLFTNSHFWHWRKKLPAELKQFGGMTNTILGLYDWIALPETREQTGFVDFPKHADVNYDLGGGFATPDVQRLTGLPFVSLDILSPKDSEAWDLQFQVLTEWHNRHRWGVGRTRGLTSEERAQYFARLNETPWIHFDVFKDHFPDTYQSYFITSFGFLSSTVESLSEESLKAKLNFYHLTYTSTLRIVELIAKGKDVDLFAYQRAEVRDYQFRTVFLSFRNRHLQLAKFWPPLASGLSTGESGRQNAGGERH